MVIEDPNVTSPAKILEPLIYVPPDTYKFPKALILFVMILPLISIPDKQVILLKVLLAMACILHLKCHAELEFLSFGRLSNIRVNMELMT